MCVTLEISREPRTSDSQLFILRKSSARLCAHTHAASYTWAYQKESKDKHEREREKGMFSILCCVALRENTSSQGWISYSRNLFRHSQTTVTNWAADGVTLVPSSSLYHSLASYSQPAETFGVSHSPVELSRLLLHDDESELTPQKTFMFNTNLYLNYLSTFHTKFPLKRSRQLPSVSFVDQTSTDFTLITSDLPRKAVSRQCYRL